jgi:hypothetical protein
MPWIVGLAIAAGSFLYVVASYFLLVKVVPGMLAVLGLSGTVAGVAVAVALAVTVLSDRYSGTHLVAPRERYPNRDWAWPQYFAAQLGADLRAVVDWGFRPQVWAWRRVNPVVGAAFPWILLLWPLPLAVYAALLAFSAGVLLGTGGVVVLAAVFGAVAWSAGLPAVGALRAVDLVWQCRLRADASCPRCYFVSRLPVYRCPNAECPWPVHRDLRPGRLGVLWRHCGCGTVLPTTVLRASRRLTALCQECGEELHRDAGVVTDVRIPVFGRPPRVSPGSSWRESWVCSTTPDAQGSLGWSRSPVAAPCPRPRT